MLVASVKKDRLKKVEFLGIEKEYYKMILFKAFYSDQAFRDFLDACSICKKKID